MYYNLVAFTRLEVFFNSSKDAVKGEVCCTSREFHGMSDTSTNTYLEKREREMVKIGGGEWGEEGTEGRKAASS